MQEQDVQHVAVKRTNVSRTFSGWMLESASFANEVGGCGQGGNSWVQSSVRLLCLMGA